MGSPANRGGDETRWEQGGVSVLDRVGETPRTKRETPLERSGEWRILGTAGRGNTPRLSKIHTLSGYSQETGGWMWTKETEEGLFRCEAGRRDRAYESGRLRRGFCLNSRQQEPQKGAARMQAT